MKKLSEPVLVIKGAISNCEKLSLALNHDGFSVIETTSYDEVQLIVQSRPPFLIVSDFDLKGGSVLELCRLIKQTHSQIPFVIIASDVDKDLALASLNSGVDELLETPVSAEQVKRVVLKYSQSRLKQIERERLEALEATQLFLDEFEELAMDLDPNIQAIEHDASALRSLVRRVHIIRGAAASLPQGLGSAISELGTAFEESLVYFLEANVAPSKDSKDLFLQTSVMLKELVESLKAAKPLDDKLSSQLVAAHQALRGAHQKLLVSK